MGLALDAIMLMRCSQAYTRPFPFREGLTQSRQAERRCPCLSGDPLLVPEITNCQAVKLPGRTGAVRTGGA